MPTIVPHLWFDTEAEDAAKFYCSIFDNSEIHDVHHFGEVGPDERVSVSTVHFEIEGQRVIALNAGPAFKLDEAFSFFVECDTQDEVDTYWNKLTDGGQESQCGWLKDRYGVSWQIIPKLLGELMSDPDKERAGRATQAMLQMRKIDSTALQAAFDG